MQDLIWKIIDEKELEVWHRDQTSCLAKPQGSDFKHHHLSFSFSLKCKKSSQATNQMHMSSRFYRNGC
jgi:hypothetical protein